MELGGGGGGKGSHTDKEPNAEADSKWGRKIIINDGFYFEKSSPGKYLPHSRGPPPTPQKKKCNKKKEEMGTAN